MNEKIKQLLALADQNTLVAIAQSDIKLDSEDFNAIKFEKFADLIIKECSKVIDKDIKYQFEQGVIANLGGLNQAKGLIKQHFGIKE